MTERHRRFPALAEIAGTLALDDFWFLFREVWTDCEALFPHHNSIRDMLVSERMHADERFSVHTKKELAWFREIGRRGRPLKVYRGGVARNIVGFSWTTSRPKAEAFARRYGNPKPLVATGKVLPDQIVLLLDENGEREVVAFPEHVSVKKVDEIAPEREQTNDDRVTIVANAFGIRHVTGQAEIDDIRVKLSRLRERVPAERAIAAFRKDRDTMRELGFETRAKELDDLIGKLATDPYGEMAAAHAA